MRDTIKYFMWGYQHLFRTSLEMASERVLQEVGFPVKPRCLLVGFAATPDAAWPVCIEPENRFFQPAHLEAVRARAAELYKAHPDYQTLHTDQRSHELFHESLRDSCRAAALVEALNRHSPEPVTYFAGRSTRVGDYDVHPVVGVPSELLEQVPHLVTTERDRFSVIPSLVHGSISVTLALATRALVLPDAGADLNVIAATADEVSRRAATNLVTCAVRMTGGLYGAGVYAALSAVSTTRYEGASGYGSVIAARQSDPDLVIDVRLRQPVHIAETRALRKLLEISDRDKLGLLTDGSVIFGLGHVASTYDATAERIFEFHVVGQGQWLLRHGETVLFETEFGQPRLRRARMDERGFKDTVNRLFRDANADAAKLWELAQIAAEQAHGTMLVISAAAADEAVRLGAQAIVIEPTALDSEVIRQATAIDGAVLFDPSGTCHALGLILDGRTTGKGNRARGARFNSALRYLSAPAAPTMIVLVSEDGMINVLPYLRPRIARATVKSALATFERLTTTPDVDGELRSDAYDRLHELAFYLTSEQCAAVNRLEREYQERQLREGGFQITGRDLKPDPEMDDSYFLD